jgi:antitoxin VapB
MSSTQLNIKNPETRRLARELAELTGRSVTEVVADSLRERLEREKRARSKAGVAEKRKELADEVSRLPVLDDRDPDEILYDEYGLPE